MNKAKFLKTFRGMSGKQKIVSIGLILLLAIGALGVTTSVFDTKEDSLLSNIAEKVGLKKPKATTNYQPTNPPTGPLQLSKEYVYAGSRTLSVEDYGVVPANPSPTPPTASGGGGSAPTPTPTPNPTPTPEIYNVTSGNCYNAPYPVSGTFCYVYWTASVSRPANVDKITFHPNTNPSLEFFPRFTQGGTSGNIGSVAMPSPPAKWIVKFWKDGNTLVLTKTLPE